MRRIAERIATAFGLGLSPLFPGTVGTLGSLILWAPLLWLRVPKVAYLGIVALVFIVGWWAAKKTAIMWAQKDPSAIVIDEVAGFGLTLAFCPPHLSMVILAFLLFRFFDIVKPWPVSWFDKMEGGLGIMLDDMAAGLMAGVLIWIWVMI